ncbi:MAG: Panacea domain-containing protein [Alphaproteobacteria bacterium]
MKATTKSNHKDVKPVADYFISLLETQNGDMMSNLKLQKLCYLAQGWYVARYDEVLFDNDIQAWALGPVVVDLYYELRRNKKNYESLSSADITTKPYNMFSKKQKEFLEAIWFKYGVVLASQLVMLTHRHKPWIDAYRPDIPPRHKRCDKVITIESMKSFFRGLDEKAMKHKKKQ